MSEAISYFRQHRHDERKLTWHKGTILPFASLWYTLVRIAALNYLEDKELPKGELLFNDNGNFGRQLVAIEDVAACIGEPASSFSWSDLGSIPPALRFLVLPWHRICIECQSLGYHTSLFSLKLLEACPIHGTLLLDRCLCGERFDVRAKSHGFDRIGYCKCGRMRLFTIQTCRQPKLSPADTRPLQPVVDWLTHIVRILIPTHLDRAAREVLQVFWSNHLLDWCDALEIEYPKCFVEAKRHPELKPVVYTTKSIGKGNERLSAWKSRRAPRNYLRPTYWGYTDLEEQHVYRSMLRHFRRHIVRDGDRIAPKFLARPDPISMAAEICDDEAAKRACAGFLWSNIVEKYASLRRWPYRRDRGCTPENYPRFATEGCWHSASRTSPKHVHDSTFRWIEDHIKSCSLIARWRLAQEIAERGASDGLVNWGEPLATDAYRWCVYFGSDCVRFVQLEGQTRRDWTLPAFSKDIRRERQRTYMADRLLAITAACMGPCLTFTPPSEWAVAEGMVPTVHRIDYHNLFMAGQDRARFWLFQSHGRFVARLVNVKLQIVADTPKSAIECLRIALTKHRTKYPERVTPPASSSYARTHSRRSLIDNPDVAGREGTIYTWYLEEFIKRDGFLNSFENLRKLAVWFRSARMYSEGGFNIRFEDPGAAEPCSDMKLLGKLCSTISSSA